MATLEVINIGAAPNDGSGDPLRTAFQKINNNFAYIGNTWYNTTEAVTIGNTTQEIWSVPVTDFTQATFQINSAEDSSNNSQNIIINAAISNDGTDVKFTAHSTTFFGNAVTNYSMAVANSNVVLFASPLVGSQINHFITYQVTSNLTLLVGTYMVLNQDAEDGIATEQLQVLTTEG